ncbi:MAG: aminopeptidase P family protein [Thermodesulfobacteria bacterium]|nr:aminopeptidase P family protein [Thermodesulfobacteriota bacterium]
MKNEIDTRLSRLRRSLVARDLQAVLVTCPENRYYLSGFWAEDLGLGESAGCLLITRNENLLLTDGRYKEQATKEAPLFQVQLYKKGLPALLKQLFRDLDIKRCGFEPPFLPVATYKKIKHAIVPATLVDFGDLIFKMRAIKDHEELAKIGRAQEVAEEVFADILPELKAGVTEREVAFLILKGLYLKADGPSFPPIVASGPNAALPHAIPGNRELKAGEPIIIDMGARLDGYCSDMTRTMFIGEPDPYFKEIYNVVKDAQEAAQRFIRAGIRCKDADGAAREIIEQRGFGEYFVHSLGHGVGIAIHEAPAVSFRNRKLLRAGMVITVEPGIYIPGKGGVRLENMAVVEENGCRLLTSSRFYYEFQ